MSRDYSRLTTEQRNPRSRDLDRCDTLAIVDIINAEDRKVAPAVASQRREIAAAIELIVESLRQGGRLFYVGAGTSGRLGVLDAAESPPTFGTRSSLVQGIIAGGRRALVRAVEGAEDCANAGQAAIDKHRIRSKDVVIGIAACGLTPFVRGALRRARTRGAHTVFITCAPEAKPLPSVDVVINPVVGPEVISGSTRMKAGTATKLILNTLSTTAMVRLGKVYGNLMVDVRATSTKLRDRAERIVMSVTGLTRPRARKLLHAAEGHAKLAIVMHCRGVSRAVAQRLLRQAKHMLRPVIEGRSA